MNRHEKIGVVVVGHGSRNREAILEFQKLFALLLPFEKEMFEYGFLEFERPGIEEAIHSAITRGAKKIVVLPVMLTAAHHVKTDIPNLIQKAKQKSPHIPIYYGRHLGLHPKIQTLCKNRIQEALSERQEADPKETLLIVVGRGTSDSAGNEDVITLTGLLSDCFDFGETRYCYTSIATPLFKDALEEARCHPARSLLIFPYLLFSGILANKIEEGARQFQEENPGRLVKLARPLGPDSWVADALRDRYDEAILGLYQKKTNEDEENGKNTA